LHVDFSNEGAIFTPATDDIAGERCSLPTRTTCAWVRLVILFSPSRPTALRFPSFWITIGPGTGVRGSPECEVIQPARNPRLTQLRMPIRQTMCSRRSKARTAPEIGFVFGAAAGRL